MLTLTDEQKCRVAVEFRTAAGNPAQVDGVPEWSSSDESILTVEPEADGMAATVTTVGPLGNAQVRLTADADLGAGTRTLNGVLDVEVVAAEATVALLVAGAPEPKVAPEPEPPTPPTP